MKYDDRVELSGDVAKKYTHDNMPAVEAQRLAQFIAWAPVVFNITDIMVRWGILQLLSDHSEGLTTKQVAELKNISDYSAQILLEGSLSIGTVYLKDGLWCIAKPGRFLLHGGMAKSDMDFVRDVNYLGMARLEDALKSGRPEGLKVFGDWPTIYEGLSQLPPKVQKSWFGYDHFYSDNSFKEALDIVLKDKTRNILDIGGNTGRFACFAIDHDPEVRVTIMDLPQQIELMRKATNSHPGSERIGAWPCDMLDKSQEFPRGFDVLWMSQFLDCFSNKQVVDILTRAARSMGRDSRLYIMETLWDKQKYETASLCLTMGSAYFTAMANGNSKFFYSKDLIEMIEDAGLEVKSITDGLGLGHSLIECTLRPQG